MVFSGLYQSPMKLFQPHTQGHTNNYIQPNLYIYTFKASSALCKEGLDLNPALPSVSWTSPSCKDVI